MVIPILEPQVLRGVVEQLATPEDLVLLSGTPRQPWAFPSASWDIVRGARNVAKPNVPNSEAHTVGVKGRQRNAAGFVYLREKKVFEPTTVQWLRASGDAAKRNAEQAVMREITDLNRRFDNFAEMLLWKAYSGRIQLEYSDVTVDVDYGFADDHKINVPTALSAQTVSSFTTLVQQTKQMVSQTGQVALTDAYLSDAAMTSVYQMFTDRLSDRGKDEYLRSGTIPDLFGLAWHPISSVYEDNGVVTPYVADNVILFANAKTNRPIELYEGPTADHEAPEGHTGKFSKSWEDPDPSGFQHLLEWSILPVITRPDQFATATFATS